MQVQLLWLLYCIPDYPVTEPPSGNISSSTVGPIVGILIAVIISAIVAVLLIIRRRKNKMQPNSKYF